MTAEAADQQRGWPDVRSLVIEVNGVEVGRIRAIPDAPRELATGWCMLHKVFQTDARVVTSGLVNERIGLMIEGRVNSPRDPFEMRFTRASQGTPSGIAPNVEHVHDVFAQFQRAIDGDGANEGYVHVALSTRHAVRIVARDVTAHAAIAKVLGWSREHDPDYRCDILLINGVFDVDAVHACNLRAIRTAITCFPPTRQASEAAVQSRVALWRVGDEGPSRLIGTE